MEKYYHLLWAGAGGFIGASMRYIVSIIVPSVFLTRFPLATFISNIMGSFALGIFTEAANKLLIIKPEIFILLTVGICGGFTTFSTLIHESYHFLKEDLIFKAIAYGAISYITGFLSLYAGISLVRYFWG